MDRLLRGGLEVSGVRRSASLEARVVVQESRVGRRHFEVVVEGREAMRRRIRRVTDDAVAMEHVQVAQMGVEIVRRQIECPPIGRVRLSPQLPAIATGPDHTHGAAVEHTLGESVRQARLSLDRSRVAPRHLARIEDASPDPRCQHGQSWVVRLLGLEVG